MVFKIASGVSNKLVWDVYRSSETANENVTAALDVTNQYQDHYKNRVILNWETFNATQVRNQGGLQAQLTYRHICKLTG